MKTLFFTALFLTSLNASADEIDPSSIDPNFPALEQATKEVLFKYGDNKTITKALEKNIKDFIPYMYSQCDLEVKTQIYSSVKSGQLNNVPQSMVMSAYEACHDKYYKARIETLKGL